MKKDQSFGKLKKLEFTLEEGKGIQTFEELKDIIEDSLQIIDRNFKSDEKQRVSNQLNIQKGHLNEAGYLRDSKKKQKQFNHSLESVRDVVHAELQLFSLHIGERTWEVS